MATLDQTNVTKTQSPSRSITLGSGLPFVSTLLRKLTDSYIEYNNLQQLKDQILEIESQTPPPSPIPPNILDVFGSQGGIELNEIPPDWNHELWNKIQERLSREGLKSMGVAVSNDILRLIATLAVLMDIRQSVFPELDPVDLTSYESVEEQVIKTIDELKKQPVELSLSRLSLIKSLMFVIEVNQRHPLVYRTLELGNSWEEAVENLTEGHNLLQIDELI